MRASFGAGFGVCAVGGASVEAVLSFPPIRGEFVYWDRGCGLVRILPVGPFRLLSAGGAGCSYVCQVGVWARCCW